MGKYVSLEDRLLANSVRADHVGDLSCWYEGSFCWLWAGKRNSKGYGFVSMRRKSGPNKGKPRNYLAHKVSLVAFKNRVVSGRRVVKHLCNNRLCINPEHLQGGTQRSNIRQCVRDGRHWSGFKGRKLL